jgi:DNA-3-methyladenine glycosylase
MHITKQLNGHDLLSDDFLIALPENAARHTIVKRPRVGVDYARHWAKRHLRFYVKGNAFVSRK